MGNICRHIHRHLTMMFTTFDNDVYKYFTDAIDDVPQTFANDLCRHFADICQ